MAFHLDLGNVPAWIGAGSLLLAFRIFMRDRSRGDRAQVDKVGIWGEVQGAPLLPDGRQVDEARVRLCVRNASDLPVEITQVAWIFRPQWAEPYRGKPYPVVGKHLDGKQAFLPPQGPLRLGPQQTQEGYWYPVSLAQAAPAGDGPLYFLSEESSFILFALVTDNAGRRWELRPSWGVSARRIRWYSRPHPLWPHSWRKRQPAWKQSGRRGRTLKGRVREQAGTATNSPGGVSGLPDGSTPGNGARAPGSPNQS